MSTSPAETKSLLGHEHAETEFKRAFDTGRIHHSLLITGDMGIGKATFAYRAARYVFAHNKRCASDSQTLLLDMPADSTQSEPETSLWSDDDSDEYASHDDSPQTAQISAATDNSPLAIPPNHPVFERMLSGGILDFKVVERGYSDADRTKRRGEITVEQIRDLKEFFTTTPSEEGFRVALIDSMDEVNEAGQNAILKLLEEPPKDTILMLVTHNPRSVLSTIRSRCRTIRLGAVGEHDMRSLMDAHLPNLPPENRAATLEFARGSIGRAIRFANANGAEIARMVAARDMRRLGALSANQEAFRIISELVLDEISDRAKKEPSDGVFRLYDEVSARLGEVLEINLDPTASLIGIFERINSVAKY